MNGGIGFDGDLAPWPWWIGSVGGAIGLISYERNADRIHGIFYVCFRFPPKQKRTDPWR